VKKVLLPETKIGEFLTIGIEQERDEIGLFLASTDVSASCAFKFDEWDRFIKAINRAELPRGLVKSTNPEAHQTVKKVMNSLREKGLLE